MKNQENRLNRLYSIYQKLTKNEKEKIIKFGESLLKSQNIIYEEKETFEKDKIEEPEKYKYLPLIIPSSMKIYEFKNEVKE